MSCYTTFFIISKDDFRKLQEDKSMLIDAAKSAIKLISINSRGDFAALVDGMYEFDDYTEVDKSHWDRIYSNYIDLQDDLKNHLKRCEAVYNRLTAEKNLRTYAMRWKKLNKIYLYLSLTRINLVWSLIFLRILLGEKVIIQ